MPRKHPINDPMRRIAKLGQFPAAFFEHVRQSTRYEGSALHKSRWADYGFHPPTNPRDGNSLCDGHRKLLKAEAEALLSQGIERQMISTRLKGELELPKYIWAVDDDGEAYEAKLGGDGRSYHGYRLEDDEQEMRETVIHEWEARS